MPCRLASRYSEGTSSVSWLSPSFIVPCPACARPAPSRSERALGHGDHVTRLRLVVGREVALLQDAIQADRVGARAIALLAIELGAVGRRELGGAAGGEHRIEHR